MTTIAWDGRTLAADTLGTISGFRSQFPTEKIVSRGSMAFGLTGYGGLINAWIEWYQAGADPANTPKHGFSDNDTGNFIVFRDGVALVFSHLCPYPLKEGAPWGWGSGGEVALGAMLHGATAEQAVAHAMSRDTRSGGAIQTIDLHALMATPIRRKRNAA